LCEDNLAPYQRPADLHFVEALPITPANKLDRVALRDMAADL
jgi:acyl-coenzyme A synthetase/AMP-(fatty) acid ligase